MEEFQPIPEVVVVTVGFVVTGAGSVGVGVAAAVPPELPPPPPPPPPQLISSAANPRIIVLLAKLCFFISFLNCFKLVVIVTALLSILNCYLKNNFLNKKLNIISNTYNNFPIVFYHIFLKKSLQNLKLFKNFSSFLIP